MSWVLIDVGCIECEDSTKHLGVFVDGEAVLAEIARRGRRAVELHWLERGGEVVAGYSDSLVAVRAGGFS